MPVSARRTTTNPWDVLNRARIYYRDPRGNGARFPVRLGDWITTRAGNEARIVEVIGRPVQALIAPDRRTGEPRILHAHSPDGYAAPSHFVVEVSC